MKNAFYSNFRFPSSPLFLPVGHCLRRWLKINLKVYDVSNWLNKNLIGDFVWYHQKEKRYDIQTLSTDRVLNKDYFSGKIMQKMYTKALMKCSSSVLWSIHDYDRAWRNSSTYLPPLKKISVVLIGHELFWYIFRFVNKLA